MTYAEIIQLLRAVGRTPEGRAYAEQVMRDVQARKERTRDA